MSAFPGHPYVALVWQPPGRGYVPPSAATYPSKRFSARITPTSSPIMVETIGHMAVSLANNHMLPDPAQFTITPTATGVDIEMDLVETHPGAERWVEFQLHPLGAGLTALDDTLKALAAVPGRAMAAQLDVATINGTDYELWVVTQN